MYSNKENVNILTALLVSYGVEHIVVCPGSRNAPLVHNFNECPDITCYPVTDERSAGFIAMGMREKLNRPVAVCVTSGSALLNVHPTVAEATYQHQGIIIISADRPAAWIDQLDGQTLPQPDALGRFVAKSVNLPEPHDDTERWHCKRLVCEAMIAYHNKKCPCVHINVPISEPLFEFTESELPKVKRVEYEDFDDDTFHDDFLKQLAKAKKPMFILGQLPEEPCVSGAAFFLSMQRVVLYEQLSLGRQSLVDAQLYTISHNPEAYMPDIVVYIGGHTVSKRLRQFMRQMDDSVPQYIVNETGTLTDVSQHTSCVIKGTPAKFLDDTAKYLNDHFKQNAFLKKWNALYAEVKKRHDRFQPSFSSMLAVKAFEEEMQCLINKKSISPSVYCANSMSVRLGTIYADHYIHCNRGVNGIEGSLSAAAGASLINEGLTFCIIGDLSFFYDENALWQQQLRGNFRILLLNNGQGGIFRNLKGLDKSPVRDEFVSARHHVSAEGVCQQFGVNYLKATDEASLQQGIKALCTQKSDSPVLLEVITDIDEDEKVFKEYYHNLIK